MVCIYYNYNIQIYTIFTNSMYSLLALAFVFIFVLIVQYNCDKIEILLEKIVEKFFNCSVQHLNIRVLQVTIQKAIFISQCGMLIADWIGVWGFIRAINDNSYYFVVIILWIEVFDKLSSFSPGAKYKKYWTPMVVKGLKLIISLYFNSSISVLSNASMLVFLVFVNPLMKKAKYILLKLGLVTFINNLDINEDSLESVIENMLTNTKKLIHECDLKDLQISKSIIDICKNAENIINNIRILVDDFYQDVNDRAKYLYICKIMGSIISYFIILHPSIHLISPYLKFTIFIKLVIIIVDPLTPINSAMDNVFGVILETCSNFKKKFVAVRGTVVIGKMGGNIFSRWLSS